VLARLDWVRKYADNWLTNPVESRCQALHGEQPEQMAGGLVSAQVARTEPSFSSNGGLQRPAFAAPPVVLALERPAIESVSAVATPAEQVTAPSLEAAPVEPSGTASSAPDAREQINVPPSLADASAEVDSPSPAAGSVAEQPAATLPVTTTGNGAGDGAETVGTTGDHSMMAAAGNGGAASKPCHARCVQGGAYNPSSALYSAIAVR